MAIWETKHDNLIELIINDQNFDIKIDGTIWSNRPFVGRGILQNFRRMDRYGSNKKYLVVAYRIDKSKHTAPLLLVHRIIYRKFIGPLDDELTVNHKDGNKINNKPENLEWKRTN